MKFFSGLKEKFQKKKHDDVSILGGGGVAHNIKTNEVFSYYNSAYPPPSLMSFFSGETTPMIFGDTKVYDLDYYTLRERSWQLYAENDLASIIINRLATFVVGTGLKLQAEPSSKVLSNYKIEFNTQEWSMNIEALFSLYAGSKISDYSHQSTLHQLAKTAYVNSKVSGDVLIISRVGDNGYPNIQLIDGANVVNPPLNIEGKAKGSRIKDGVEIDSSGKHLAYWVRSRALKENTKDTSLEAFQTVRIPVYGEKSGRKLAWLLYGSKYRLGETRGMPLLSCVMQKLKQLDRYTKAELTAAEENAKFVASIVHKEFSSGENPLRKTGIGSRSNRNVKAPELTYSQLSGDQIAGELSKSTSGTVVNLGIGQELKSHDTKRPNVSYEQFVDAVFKSVCAACEIPQEVALMLFSNNYSASRAALKMFEEVLSVQRYDNATVQFYKPIYESFVIVKSLQGFIDTKGFFKAYKSKDPLFLEAYFKCRFIGKPIPNVDELKEVKASIEKINNKLSTHERETEKLGNGDYSDNVERLKVEQDQSSELNENKEEDEDVSNTEEDEEKEK